MNNYNESDIEKSGFRVVTMFGLDDKIRAGFGRG
jgi:hypothetical protein